ncbi:hypothetical protein MLC52_10890 [Sulfurimonas sp. NW15]|uniref:coiled-coil domain-containing protein n=1 Tax=Sulfurimonas sp. NW15 TaxID=2922729 RepID=UPI003DA95C45
MKQKPKNFYTEFLSMKTIKDLVRIADYITDRNDNHINHSSDNHKTVVFDNQTDVDRKLRNIINIANFHTTRIKLNRKGGKPSSPATSIMISLPEIIGEKRISLEDMKKLHNIMIRDIVSKLNEIYKLNFTKNEAQKFINDYVISSIHFKKNNPHINIMLPSVVKTFTTIEKDNKKYRATNKIKKLRLGLRKFSYQTKLLVEQNMLKMGYSLSDYVIKKVRKNNKQNPIASMKQDIKDERLKQEKISTQMVEQTEEQKKLNIQLQKLVKRMEVYSRRAEEELAKDREQMDLKRLEKNKRLYDKSKDKYDLLKKALSSSYNNSPSIDLTPK